MAKHPFSRTGNKIFQFDCEAFTAPNEKTAKKLLTALAKNWTGEQASMIASDDVAAKFPGVTKYGSMTEDLQLYYSQKGTR